MTSHYSLLSIFLTNYEWQCYCGKDYFDRACGQRAIDSGEKVGETRKRRHFLPRVGFPIRKELEEMILEYVSNGYRG